MFNIGDRVQHQDTGSIGIVAGYGHRIVNNKCLTTIKVKLERSKSIKETVVIEPDSKWLLARAERKTRRFNSPAIRSIEKPVKKYVLSNQQNGRASAQ